jgi:hypothetical protein
MIAIENLEWIKSEDEKSIIYSLRKDGSIAVHLLKEDGSVSVYVKQKETVNYIKLEAVIVKSKELDL